MSTQPAADAARSFAAANRASDHQQSWMMSFQAACMRHDWEAAEAARAGVLASIDSFMDNYAAGYKRMESA